MADQPAPSEPTGAESTPREDTATPEETAAPLRGAELAEANKRRMRAALDHKKGVKHPDDAAQGGGGVRDAAAPGANKDFSRRKSG